MYKKQLNKKTSGYYFSLGFFPRNYYITGVDVEAKLSTEQLENWRVLKVFTLQLNTLVTPLLNVVLFTQISVIHVSDDHILQPNLLLKNSGSDNRINIKFTQCRECSLSGVLEKNYSNRYVPSFIIDTAIVSFSHHPCSLWEAHIVHFSPVKASSLKSAFS